MFDKINDLMNPSFADEKPINPFDFWAGANFKLKIRQVEGYRNYDKSEFDSQSALLDGDDEKLEAVYKQLHSLQEFLAPSNFKSYDELKRKLDSVLNPAGGGAQRATAAAKAALDDAEEDLPWNNDTKEAAPQKELVSESEGADDPLEYFRRLASEED